MRKLIVLLSASLLLSAIPAQAQPPAKDTAAQLKSLLKERRDVLRKLVEILVSQYRVGTVNFNRVAHAESRLADAELESAMNKDERIAVCRKQVELCRDIEKICQKRFEFGQVSQADLLDASAEGWKTEVRLLREKAADKPAEVESLLKERRDALQKLVEILVSQYRVGTVNFNRVAHAESRLADAELESAMNKHERITVCRKQVELCRDIEKICRARFDAGTVNEGDLDDATAERLKAEVRLLREKAGDKQAQVESLLKERRAALQKLVEILVSQYQVGTVDFNRVSYAMGRLADAELESAKNNDDRIAACQKQVELCQDVEKTCRARFDAGSVSEADLLDARAERLTAEILLLRGKKPSVQPRDNCTNKGSLPLMFFQS